MEVTHVEILPPDTYESDEGARLRAYCSITLDGEFVVHDLRLIEGNTGLFVAMPSRKLTHRCPGCDFKCARQSRYCSNCGKHLGGFKAQEGQFVRLHADIAHPCNQRARDKIELAVQAAYARTGLAPREPRTGPEVAPPEARRYDPDHA
jgi:stage V sporulation protein G